MRRRYWPKYCKNERQGAGGQTGSENMAATRYFDSATPTSYSTFYTLWKFTKIGPYMKGMMTLTYDLDLLHKYLGPKPNIRHQVWTLYDL